MDGVRFYDGQGSPRTTVLVAFYEQYRETRGSTDEAKMEAIRFAEYLLDRIDDFKTEVKEL